jgi:hypothetical protein
LQISDERKKWVIDLYLNQHKTYAEIAEIERISPRNIHVIIKEEIARRQKHKDQELSSKAYKLFSEDKKPVEVAVALNPREPEVTNIYREYWRLKRLHTLNLVYKDTNGKLGPFLKLYQQLMKEKGMSIEQVVIGVDTSIHKLPYMENLYRQAKDQAEKMQRTIQRLENEIEVRKNKISILDKITLSIELEHGRKEQQVQELTDKKDRLEKLIANILNGEGYSKLKQIIKENVKVVLSENKKLISISFVALIQTIKADPQMVKLIQNIAGANDGEQHKDNHINISQYFESNKDSILHLIEKNYENLVEELAKNVISSLVADSSSNPKLSSTFPNLLNQSDT